MSRLELVFAPRPPATLLYTRAVDWVGCRVVRWAEGRNCRRIVLLDSCRHLQHRFWHTSYRIYNIASGAQTHQDYGAQPSTVDLHKPAEI